MILGIFGLVEASRATFTRLVNTQKKKRVQRKSKYSPDFSGSAAQPVERVTRQLRLMRLISRLVFERIGVLPRHVGGISFRVTFEEVGKGRAQVEVSGLEFMVKVTAEVDQVASEEMLGGVLGFGVGGAGLKGGVISIGIGFGFGPWVGSSDSGEGEDCSKD